MTPSRPYLIRALYEWIIDNNLTPYIIVEAGQDALIPIEYVENGRIVLNISMTAVQDLSLGNEALEFKARFAGVIKHIYAPIHTVMAIYAKENGRGMVFSAEDLGDDYPGGSGGNGGGTQVASTSGAKTNRPNLKLVK